MRYPERLLTEDEEIVTQFRPHWKVLLPSIGWAMLLAAGFGAVVAATPDLGWRGTAAAAAFVLWLVLSAKSVVDWVFTNYVLTTERIVVRRGFIARTGTEIPLENIVNVLFSQSVIERVLGYGDVLIESAGSQGQSRLEDIPDPQGFQSEVYAAREQRALHFSGRSGGGARDVVAQLEALADLHARGSLSDEEFERGKARLLGAPGASEEPPSDGAHSEH